MASYRERKTVDTAQSYSIFMNKTCIITAKIASIRHFMNWTEIFVYNIELKGQWRQISITGFLFKDPFIVAFSF
jgi:hypothetical protein